MNNKVYVSLDQYKIMCKDAELGKLVKKIILEDDLSDDTFVKLAELVHASEGV
jgi:hypothetical protein